MEIKIALNWAVFLLKKIKKINKIKVSHNGEGECYED
jgi:hypothetical protein